MTNPQSETNAMRADEEPEPRAVVIQIVNGVAEVHYIDAAIAREAIERHYDQRRIY